MTRHTTVIIGGHIGSHNLTSRTHRSHPRPYLVDVNIAYHSRRSASIQTFSRFFIAVIFVLAFCRIWPLMNVSSQNGDSPSAESMYPFNGMKLY